METCASASRAETRADRVVIGVAEEVRRADGLEHPTARRLALAARRRVAMPPGAQGQAAPADRSRLGRGVGASKAVHAFLTPSRAVACYRGRMTIRRSDARDGSGAPREPSDVIDFFLRWREFREIATTLENKQGLSAKEREVARWLVAVMDRISARDVQ